jgi:Zn finger protein HypA/HybF involved in hydrogenase expression
MQKIFVVINMKRKLWICDNCGNEFYYDTDHTRICQKCNSKKTHHKIGQYNNSRCRPLYDLGLIIK